MMRHAAGGKSLIKPYLTVDPSQHAQTDVHMCCTTIRPKPKPINHLALTRYLWRNCLSFLTLCTCLHETYLHWRLLWRARFTAMLNRLIEIGSWSCHLGNMCLSQNSGILESTPHDHGSIVKPLFFGYSVLKHRHCQTTIYLWYNMMQANHVNHSKASIYPWYDQYNNLNSGFTHYHDHGDRYKTTSYPPYDHYSHCTATIYVPIMYPYVQDQNYQSPSVGTTVECWKVWNQIRRHWGQRSIIIFPPA